MNSSQTSRLRKDPGRNGHTKRAAAIHALLYRGKQPAPRSMPELPTFKVLHGVEQAVMRSEPVLEPRLMTGVKGNRTVNTHHANQDQSSFVLYAHGDYLLIDPGYFEGEPIDHSLILPKMQNAEKAQLNVTAQAPLTGWERGELRSVSVKAHKAYTSGGNGVEAIRSIRRLFVQVADDATIVVDDVKATNAGQSLVSRFQAGFPAKVKDERVFQITGDTAILKGHLFGPEVRVHVKGPNSFSDQSWVYPDHLKKIGGAWHTVRVTHSLDPSRPLVTVLVPHKADEPVASSSPQVEYGDNQILVKLAGPRVIKLQRHGNRWEVKP